MAGSLHAIGARILGTHRPARRDGAPPTQDPPKKDPGKGGPSDATAVRLGPLPGRDVYIPSGERPAQSRPASQPPSPPTWPDGRPAYPQPPASQVPPAGGNGSTFVPLGPGFTNPEGPALVADREKTAREERPLTLAGGMGGIEGKHASFHYNLSDKTAVGGSVGRIEAEGIGINSYTLDMRQYVASEKNWGIYIQPGIHALQNTSGFGKEWGGAASAQAGLEWRTSSGITFNVFGGAFVDSFDKKVKPTAGFSIGLSF